MSDIRVIHGDCVAAMASLPDSSVDSCVTDPPYFLTSIVDRFGSEKAAPNKQGNDGRFARLSAGFMGRKWDAPEMPPIDPGFAHWMAGFIDGEGCFHVHKKFVNGCETYDCQFSITLRADDADIIAEIKRQMGGIGSIAERQPKQENAGRQVRYCISSKIDCLKLREVLRLFPLRAKKARDFEVWSLALDDWLAHEPGSSWEGMAYFRDYLMALRRYGSTFRPEQLFHYRWAREVFRVLKPGGHLLAFGGTRTYHRLACAIEDAGFEIRDMTAWLYGSGFPKSHDVSKSIDKRGGQQVAWFGPWMRAWRAECGITQKEIAALFPSRTGQLTGCVANWELGLNMPTPEQFNLICTTFNLPFDSLEAAERAVISHNDRPAGWFAEQDGHDVTAPATEAAKQWEGWGTALKPAMEPIVLARKPLIGTVAENVLKHGTGALNIDGCRIAASTRPAREHTGRRGNIYGDGLEGSRSIGTTDLGRWPANVIHDGSDEVLRAFPGEAGAQGKVTVRNADKFRHSYGEFKGATEDAPFYGDAGTAARFFYSAKADADDRLGSKHPTVKPVDLIAYLCRLITPPGGTVLDCFAGSGTTGMACMREGFNAVLIEREAEYVADIKRRIAHVQGLDAPLFAEAAAQ